MVMVSVNVFPGAPNQDCAYGWAADVETAREPLLRPALPAQVPNLLDAGLRQFRSVVRRAALARCETCAVCVPDILGVGDVFEIAQARIEAIAVAVIYLLVRRRWTEEGSRHEDVGVIHRTLSAFAQRYGQVSCRRVRSDHVPLLRAPRVARPANPPETRYLIRTFVPDYRLPVFTHGEDHAISGGRSNRKNRIGGA